MAARRNSPFASFDDLVRRTRLQSGALRRLAQADVFGSLELPRRGALWKALPRPEHESIYEGLDSGQPPNALPKMTPAQEVLADYGAAGLTLRQHPIAFLRPALDRRKIVPAERLATEPNDSFLSVAGLVLVRQRPSTAKGITFVTLEDETGNANLIIRQAIWEKYRRAAREAVVMLVHGRLQREGDVIHVLVNKIEDISTALGELQAMSRDFH